MKSKKSATFQGCGGKRTGDKERGRMNREECEGSERGNGLNMRHFVVLFGIRARVSQWTHTLSSLGSLSGIHPPASKRTHTYAADRWTKQPTAAECKAYFFFSFL